MAGGRGCGRRGQVPNKEVPPRDRNIKDAMVADLKRQKPYLSQRLEAQNLDGQTYDQESESSFKNPYHNRTLFWEHCGWEERHGDLGFRVDLPKFSGTLQLEGFIDWLNEVERIFD